MLDVSWEALLKVLALGAGIWLAYTLREVWVTLALVFIFVAAVAPVITRLEKKMARIWAVSLFYLIIILAVAGFIVSFVPVLVGQLNDLIRRFPNIEQVFAPLTQAGYGSIVSEALNNVSSSLSSFSSTLVVNATAFAGGVAIVVSALVISFYLLLEEKNARDFFTQVLPRHRFEAVYSTVSKVSERMGSWLRGQALLMLIIGLSNLVVYLALGVPSPLPLAIWSGLTEAIPYIGPLIGVIPALVLAFANGGLLQAVLVFIFGFILIQQLEAHIVVPRVMSKAVGLSPVFVILAVLSGFRLAGITGAILALPVAAAIAVVVEEWPNLRKLWE